MHLVYGDGFTQVIRPIGNTRYFDNTLLKTRLFGPCNYQNYQNIVQSAGIYIYIFIYIYIYIYRPISGSIYYTSLHPEIPPNDSN